MSGRAQVGGLACDHYAFRQEGADWQTWIRTGNTPLPCKLPITTIDLPSQPQFATTLRWSVNAPIDDNFNFVPPKGAQKIEFAPAVAAK